MTAGTAVPKERLLAVMEAADALTALGDKNEDDESSTPSSSPPLPSTNKNSDEKHVDDEKDTAGTDRTAPVKEETNTKTTETAGGTKASATIEEQIRSVIPARSATAVALGRTPKLSVPVPKERHIPDHKKPNSALTFPEKLMHMMSHAEEQGKDDPKYCISWLPDGKSFMVRDPETFTKEIVPLFFKRTKFSSFTRKLYRWGFRQINRGAAVHDPIIFGNDNFRRDNKALMAKMRSVTSNSGPTGGDNGTNAKQKGAVEGDGELMQHPQVSVVPNSPAVMPSGVAPAAPVGMYGYDPMVAPHAHAAPVMGVQYLPPHAHPHAYDPSVPVAAAALGKRKAPEQEVYACYPPSSAEDVMLSQPLAADRRTQLLRHTLDPSVAIQTSPGSLPPPQQVQHQPNAHYYQSIAGSPAGTPVDRHGIDTLRAAHSIPPGTPHEGHHCYPPAAAHHGMTMIPPHYHHHMMSGAPAAGVPPAMMAPPPPPPHLAAHPHAAAHAHAAHVHAAAAAQDPYAPHPMHPHHPAMVHGAVPAAAAYGAVDPAAMMHVPKRRAVAMVHDPSQAAAGVAAPPPYAVAAAAGPPPMAAVAPGAPPVGPMPPQPQAVGVPIAAAPYGMPPHEV
eukprot:CAMPEP_0197435682 /NCGR_PEP_ID=MMETSP1175-20131217/3244_1 /TAXON_ID=1003142 /ORGANISM="Triceratium dubium, Strain CCMP147" /LENGTH=615 /DNA_ID=CAMNT_0042964785 /DNA_START=113 /DNA_END=1960 /DNA_ORIENTATION=-